MDRRTTLAALAGIAAAPLAARAAEPTKIVFGYTAVTDFANLFVGIEEGFFRKRGLDVEAKFIPLNSTIPAAVQAGSLHAGGPTSSVYLQAVEGGLDHVVLGGASFTSKKVTSAGVVAKAGSGIRQAADFAGRRVGVPGLGAFLHVTFRAWLKSHGVDYKKVNFVEAAFPQHGDLLRGGSIDAVVTAEPFMGRIVDSGVGYVASYYATFLPDGEPTIVYAARRDWVQANAAAARAFQAGVLEGSDFVSKPANDARVRQHIGKFIKLPPEVLAKAQISPPASAVTARHLQYWVGLMKEQDMLKTDIDVARLVFK
jgi:NitT/TauT family transport system substrate-binding protein